MNDLGSKSNAVSPTSFEQIWWNSSKKWLIQHYIEQIVRYLPLRIEFGNGRTAQVFPFSTRTIYDQPFCYMELLQTQAPPVTYPFFKSWNEHLARDDFVYEFHSITPSSLEIQNTVKRLSILRLKYTRVSHLMSNTSCKLELGNYDTRNTITDLRQYVLKLVPVWLIS